MHLLISNQVEEPNKYDSIRCKEHSEVKVLFVRQIITILYCVVELSLVTYSRNVFI
jgi:hypothetical protein